MELKDTINGMTSAMYKDRFVAEYWQTKIRYEKLKEFNTKIEAAAMCKYDTSINSDSKPVEPKHDCPYDLLKKQQSIMGEYLHILELRSAIENVDLYEEKQK